MAHPTEQPSTLILKPIQVSPRSFKSQLETVLGALAQLRLRATVLAKLPRGSSWSADLQQYSQAVHPTPDIYLFSRESGATLDWGQTVRIPTAYPMQGHYFVWVVSETVSFLLEGQRENVSVTTPERNAKPVSEDSAGSPGTLPKVNYNITFQRPLIQKKVDTLALVLQASLDEYAEQPALEQLITEWEARAVLPEHCHAALVDAILLQGGSYQDQMQQKARMYRQQAMNASSLSTQNESLLNTLRFKDDFLNTVGQELRTPLSSIKTALPLLSSPNLKPPQRQRYLDMISRECDRQVNLIKGVLELLQIERTLTTEPSAPVMLFDILPGVVSTYQPLAQEKGIRLAYTVPNTLPAIDCPENWVRQIVIHLLSNSIRFTNPGGEVWVTAQANEDDTLLINIRDTGIGIPQNELPHVFNHFYRGRQNTTEEEGAGLGLAIVQQLLLQCGGHISVESQPEVGTHFKVKLPLHQAE